MWRKGVAKGSQTARQEFPLKSPADAGVDEDAGILYSFAKTAQTQLVSAGPYCGGFTTT
jgi:hypothetical protein